MFILTEEETELLERTLPKSKLMNVDYISYSQKIEFLLLTLNDHEFGAAATCLQRPSAESSKEPNSATKLQPNILVGTFAGAPVALIKADQKKVGVQYLRDALIHFPNAKYIISVGTSYGFQQNLIKLGDIFVSSSFTEVTGCSISVDGYTAYIDIQGNTTEVENLLHRVFCGNSSLQRNFKIYSHAVNCHVSDIITGISRTENFFGKSNIIVNPFAAGGAAEIKYLLQLQKLEVINGFIIIKSVSEYFNGLKSDEWKFKGAMTALHCVEQKLTPYIRKLMKRFVWYKFISATKINVRIKFVNGLV